MATLTQQMAPEIKLDDTSEGLHSLEQARDGKQKQKRSMELAQSSSGLSLPSMLMRTLSGNNVIPTPGAELTRRDSPSAIDPLSRHILERTRQESPSLIRSKTSPMGDAESPERESFTFTTPPARSSTEPFPSRGDVSQLLSKDTKKNRVSFLNRFRLGKKDALEDAEEEDDAQDVRPDGVNAEMFSYPIGYIPRFAEPPKYIKVKAQGKKEKDFDRVFLAQELQGLSGVELAQAGGRRINPTAKSRGEAIWALEFSKDGKYLASGGEEYIVRVWEVLSREGDQREEDATNKSSDQMRLSAPVFKRKPIHEYEGHTGTILDLSWSKNNFLLSSSMDKTVRLWHPTREECLCAFKHTDHITSIQFHPRDDRFFLAGSLDSKLRLWSIPDKSVAYWTKTNDLITAVAFTPDGKTSIVGCLSGSVFFYDTDGFRLLTQMQIRPSGRKNVRGAKITSIQAMVYPPSQFHGDTKLLITSNDSRIRIYHYRDKTLQVKLKGTENSTSQIRATFSDDARYVICGSEDKKAYIWPMDFNDKEKDKRPVESFEAHNCAVTVAIMAPVRTRQLLQASGDPIFELCNPPPVQLLSRSESHPSDLQSVADEDQEPGTPSQIKSKPEETPAYQARACHKNGNIIITADSRGRIKVFRQDCAYEKRIKANENWETGSTISRKVLNRTSSMATRHSRHSMQDSLSFTPADRVQSWRQSLDRFSLSSNSPRVSNDAFAKPSPRSSNFARSRSPGKTILNSKLNPNSGVTFTANSPVTLTSVNFSIASRDIPLRQNSTQVGTTIAGVQRRTSEFSQESRSASSIEFITPDGVNGSVRLAQKMYTTQLVNNITRQRTHDLSDASSEDPSPRQSVDTANANVRPSQDTTGHLMPKLETQPATSTPTSKKSTTPNTASAAEDSSSEEIKCRRCGSEEFKARKKAKGKNVLVCGRCGLELV